MATPVDQVVEVHTLIQKGGIKIYKTKPNTAFGRRMSARAEEMARSLFPRIKPPASIPNNQ
jgi:hypothetical protein